MRAEIEKSVKALLVGAVCGLGGAGCAAPPAIMLTAGVSAAQTGVSAFVNRELLGVIAHPLPEVYAAALVAVQDLGFTVRDCKLSERSGLITIVESDRTRTSIRLTRETSVVTSMRVRVGTMGDRLLSALILRRVQSRLAETGHSIMELDGE